MTDSAVMTAARIIMYGRPTCHLCEYAREALARVRAATGVSWVEVSVTSDPELEREYGDRVPVIMLDGREHSWFRVEEDRLLRDLGVSDTDSHSGTVLG
jgi:glutaredoxin